MANITKRINRDGSISWRVRLMKYGQTRTATFPTKGEALEWITKQEHEILNQKYFPERRVETNLTVNDLIDRYLKEILPLKAKGSIIRQKAILRWWRQVIGEIPINNISTQLIEKWKMHLWNEKNFSPYTINLHLKTIAHVFSVAASPTWDFLLKTNPCKFVKALRTQERMPDITNEQLDDILFFSQERKIKILYPFLLIALSTGGRKSEILNLKYKHIDFERERITFVNTKNRRNRTVPVSGTLAIFAVWKLFHLSEESEYEERPSNVPDNFLFPKGATQHNINMLQKGWDEVRRTVRLPHLKIHDCRHIYASRLAVLGKAGLSEIADLLGHTSLTHTRRYVHLTESHTSDIVKRMAEGVFHTKRIIPKPEY
jgi:integrase